MTRQGNLALRALMAGFILCVPGALGEAARPEEEVSLLQAGAVQKAKQASKGVWAVEEEAKQQRKEQTCAALADGEACGGQEASQVYVSADDSGAGVSVLLGEEAAAPAPAPEEEGPSNLGLLFEVAVIALLVDGLRRTTMPKRQNKTEAAEAAKTATSKVMTAGAEFNELMRACLNGDVKLVETLLKGVTRVTGEDVWGCTPLHAAAKGGNIAIVRKLMGLGGSVHRCDAWDETALHLAARVGSSDICDLLLAHGAPIDAVSAQDWTPLVVAADAGHRATCELLLSRGAGAAGLAEEDMPRLLLSLLRPEGDAELQDDLTSYEEMQKAVCEWD